MREAKAESESEAESEAESESSDNQEALGASRGSALRARPFPIDFDALEKGDVVSEEKLREVYPAEDDLGLRLKMISLGERIMDERSDLLVRYQGPTIRIMTDLEADQVMHSRVVKNARAITRNSRRRSRIDRREFTQQEERGAAHRDLFASTMALSMRKQLAKESGRAKLLIEAEMFDRDSEAGAKGEGEDV